MTSPAQRIVSGVAACAFLFLVGLAPAPASAEPDDGALTGDARRRAIEVARRVEADLVSVVNRVADASVTVLTRRAFERGPRRGFVAGAGSGVLIAYRGGVFGLTNNHVVSHSGQLEVVTSGGTRYPARVRARDTINDLALLTIEAPEGALRAVDIERVASNRLREGAWVLATGNPFLLAVDGSAVATLGVFSGSRMGPDSTRYLLQHDAEINPGNSGGPLWNLAGELLGVNGAIVTRSMRQGGGPSYTGASISVPVAVVQAFLDQVLPEPANPPPPSAVRAAPVADQGTGAGARFGLRVASSLDGADRPDGVLVTGIVAGGLVAQSATPDRPQPGDRITRVVLGERSFDVRSIPDLDSALGPGSPGARVSLGYERGGRTRTWSALLEP